jgi:putative ABC transport system substrate-binding protein
MDRRAFLSLLAVVTGCGPAETPNKAAASRQRASAAAPTAAVDDKPATAANAPGSRMPQVATLVYGSRVTGPTSATTIGLSPIALFRGRLRELGYVEGKTIAIEERYADGDPQRLDALAAEIVAANPDVIVAIAAASTAAVRRATATIPIVMVHAGDPVGAGWAATLAKPGGNVTGSTSQVPELGSKQVELLRELVPRLARLGLLVNPTNSGAPLTLANVTAAARRFDIAVTVAEVTRGEDFDAALRTLADARLDALFVMIEPMIFLHRARILDFAAKNRVPASYDVGRETVREGGLISFGPLLSTHYALAADYVDKILKGAKPGDLPVQQPTQFALVVNVRTAKTLGLTVPPSLLARADEVIQ